MKKQLPKPDVTIVNPKLERIQRGIALATILIPTLGTIIAFAWAYIYGIHNLEIILLVVFFILYIIC